MLRINQGESSNSDANKPEMDLNINLMRYKNKSIMGLLFSLDSMLIGLINNLLGLRSNNDLLDQTQKWKGKSEKLMYM